MILFQCKFCTEELGQEYCGHVNTFKPASSNAYYRIDSEVNASQNENILNIKIF